jgi:hypothetical protein
MKLPEWLTFPRAMILGSLLGSLVTGWLVWGKWQELDQLNRDVARAPVVVESIQMKSQVLDQLLSAMNREGLKGDIVKDMETYIRRIASDPKINIGQVELTPSKAQPDKGIEDIKYKIRAKEKTQRARRGSIANFLYKLEQDSRRVKVTSIRIDPYEKLKPGELGGDSWTFEADITSRRAIEKNEG